MRILFRIVTLLILSFIFYLLFLFTPTSLSDEKIRFVVPLDPKQDLVDRLYEEKFIRSKSIFNIVRGMLKFPGTIEPGSYLLSHRSTVFGLVNTLLYHPYQKWIVLVPGLRLEQTAERLAKKFDWKKDTTMEFLKSAKEGYMFPDTYLLNIDYTGKEMALRFISNFNEKFDVQMQKDLLAQNVRLETAVKIASLIERESGGDDDKALIAGIIWNRLNIEMKLQIDATTQYIKGTVNDWWPIITPADHKTDSPYNTYIYKGLPPAPISNPGLSALKAAVYPADTECLFYLHDHSKNIHCAVTYEEHLENIEKYLK